MSQFTRLKEGNRAGEFITWEVNPSYTRGHLEIEAPADARVEPGTVNVDAEGEFAGINFYPVSRGQTRTVAVLKKGPAIVIEDLLIFPTGADAAATAALKADLKAAMELVQIDVRPEAGTDINF